MAFSWKRHSDIWKGEGIYFLTFTIAGRQKLLGKLQPVEDSRWYMENVKRFSNNNGNAQLNNAANGQLNNAEPAHFNNSANGQLSTAGGNSPLPVSTGGSPLPAGTAGSGSPLPVNISGDVSRSHNAPAPRAAAMNTCSLAVCDLLPFGMAVSRELQALPDRVPGLKVCAKQIMPDHLHVVIWLTKNTGRSIRQIANGFRIGIKRAAIALGIWNEADGHILDVPFIRTLAHKNQLRNMIDYVHANPDNAWLRHLNPDLYVIHRDIHLAGLCFDGMGKDRLLAYPDRQVIALSRSLTQEQIKVEVNRALQQAERGTVTYTAAINDGEKAVAKAIREAGFPLVVMLLKGFPPEGTEAARYFHPDGIYHKACGEGRLMLLAPKPGNYQHPALIALTEQELEKKAQAKGHHYAPIPHDTTRWRMIAGNVMLRMIADEQAVQEAPSAPSLPVNT